MRRSYTVSLIATVVLTAAAVIGAAAAGWAPLLGLDLQGGVAVTYEATSVADDEALDQAVEIIRQRVDALGVAEPDITRQGTTIVVELPGVDDAQRALALVGQTAELRFRPVLQSVPAFDPQARLQLQQFADSLNASLEEFNQSQGEPTESGSAEEDPASDTTVADTPETTETPDTSEAPESDGTEPNGTESGSEEGVTDVDADEPAAEETDTSSTTTTASTTTEPADTTDAEADQTGSTEGDDGEATTTTTPETTTTTEFDPATAPSIEEVITPPEQDDAGAYVVLPSSDGSLLHLLQPAVLTGEIVGDANPSFNGSWFVLVDFTDEGGVAWDAMAAQFVGQQLGIALDGVVESAPTIQTANFGGEATITGDFTETEAEDLALVLRFGALPVELEPQTVQTVSATLGEDALRAGVVAGLVGLALVAAYMLFYYRLLGLVAISSLTVSTGILWFLISWLGETRGLALSLSGAVGIILSIGVAVDSNIVYYERIKEEVHRGRSVRSAADGSFSGAFSTIVKADMASLIGAFILFVLTIGAVRGFALYLGVATVIDMLVSYVFMRPLVVLLARKFAANNPERLGITGVRTPEVADAEAEVVQ